MGNSKFVATLKFWTVYWTNYMLFSHYIACKWTIFISLQGNLLTGK